MTKHTMDRRQALSLLVGSGALLVPSVARGCVMTFEPKAAQTDGSGRATFTALIKLDHRRCVIGLPPDCIHLVPRSLKIVKQSGWSKVRRSLYSNRFQVQLTAGSREGSLKIWRDCSKKGISEGTIRVRAA